ncbi:MAG: hypothetical protein ACREAA_08140 [Candidatus Polarisedimenticolia bacterium]
MRSGVWLVSAAVAATVAVAALPAAQTRPMGDAAPSLAGTKWVVTVTPDEKAKAAGEKAFEDTIIFEGEMVTMTECKKAGFSGSNYKQGKTKEGVTFETTQESATEGKSTWKGEALGDSIRGTMKWKKKDGKTADFTFEGKKGS